MEQPNFIINTTLESSDYRKFLYIGTFKRNKLVLPFILLITLICSFIANVNTFRFGSIVLTWIIYIMLALLVICIKIEVKNRKRLRTDRTGTFGSNNNLEFYEDKVVMKNEAYHSIGELEYGNFHYLRESKDFFLFYLSYNQATIIRKKDIQNENNFRAFLITKFEGRYKVI